MIFICSFIFLFIFGIIFMFGVSSGFIVMSDDKKHDPPQPVRPKPTRSQPVKRKVEPKESKPQLTAYIDLSGRLIKLETKAEETKAKKDGFKIVYK